MKDWFAARRRILYCLDPACIVLFKNSVRQDQTGDKAITDKMQYWSGPGDAFAGTTTFAAFDWVMSLTPMWFSTMFGVYLFGKYSGNALSTRWQVLF